MEGLAAALGRRMGVVGVDMRLRRLMRLLMPLRRVRHSRRVLRLVEIKASLAGRSRRRGRRGMLRSRALELLELRARGLPIRFRRIRCGRIPIRLDICRSGWLSTRICR